MKYRYIKTSDLVAKAKAACSITTHNSDMDSSEIAQVCGWVTDQVFKLYWVDYGTTPGQVAVSLMKFVMLAEFPENYAQSELRHFN